MSTDGKNKRELLLHLLGSKKQSLAQNDVAIVGVSGRYPMAETLDQFWDNLRAGRNCITEVPSDRWRWEDHVDESLSQGKITNKWGGFIRDVDKFDAQFFNISPREAVLIDPQERLFLQTAWHTLEDAGYTPRELIKQCGDVGVFAGAMNSNYAILGSSLWSRAGKGKRYPCNSSFWSIANRVSYCFNFNGPSLSVDSACSSSLTAIHLACESIKRGECGAAIAGGVNLILHPAQLYNLALMNMISANGRCASFGDGADGFVDGEGVGAVLLKPLYKAIAHGDHIYAVIKASSINSGGKTSGFTVPNPNAQAELIKKVIKSANVDPRSISYIEAHGTGTSLGDPIELRGLTKAMEAHTGDKRFCAIGSVKSNIGHLESAAGISGLTKILLQMKHQTLVPSINAEPPNPHVNLDNTPFFVQQQPAPWSGARKTAGISSFGAGGANAHLILESYPGTDGAADSGTAPQLILLSAMTEAQVQTYCRNFCDFLDRHADSIALPALAYTLIVGREAFAHRLAVVASSVADLRHTLMRYLNGERAIEHLYQGHVPRNKAAGSPRPAQPLSSLAQSWVAGDVNKDDPAFLYDGLKAKRISLPVYPFLQERYWLEPQSAAQTPAAQTPAAQTPAAETLTAETLTATQDAFDDSDRIALAYWQPHWRPCPLPAQQQLSQPRGTLVFCDERANLPPFDAGGADSSMVVTFGSGFAATAVNRYAVNPADKQTFTELFTQLCKGGRSVEQIVFMSPATAPDGIQALFHLTQVLIQEKLDKQVNVVIWTKDDGSEASLHAMATAGFVKTLRIERPGFKIKQVVVTDFECLQAELLAQTDGNAVVRYENGQRLIERLVEMPLTSCGSRAAFKTGGVYLITGGAGGLGRIFAEHIARAGGMKLALTGRSPLDADKQSFVDRLTAQGNEVVYWPCDVADRNEVETLFEKIRSRFTRIDGVVHSAGVVQDAYITNKTWDQFRQVISAKIDGIVNLDAVSADDKLDFFVAFSSITAVIGNLGQSDYAYANCFMDRFCAMRRRLCEKGARSGLSLSVNWPLWDETGMTVSETVRKSLEKNIGIVPLPPPDGLATFDTVLANATAAQATPLYGYQRRIRAFLDRLNLLDAPAVQQASVVPAAVPAATMRHGDGSPKLEAMLKARVSEVLKLTAERIDADEVLNDLGFDSISLTEFAKSLQQSLNVDISPATLYTYNSINKLKAYLLQEYAGAVAGALVPGHAIAPVAVPARASTPAALTAAPQPAPAAYMVADREKVAIVGISCMFPGAEDHNAFWSNLINGMDAVSEIPVQRWRWEDHYGNTFGSANKMNSKWGAFIDGVEHFDHAFFNIPENEALYMDPQHRLFLQTVWRAIEDSGHKISELRGKSVGVFAGVEFSDYRDLLVRSTAMRPEIPIGNALNMIPNRVSFLFDFTGPSEAIDTACSGSLVAVNRAVRSIQSGESDVAIAGGVSLTLSPTTMIGTSQLNIYSPDGKCKTFDATANGYVKGEGVAAVVLKPLSAAIADGDYIYGVIRGIAVNHGGRSNSLTAPNPEAQARLLVKAYQEADIDPQRVSYIEMHGTGTHLGDPIEIEGIKSAFRQLAGLRGKPIEKIGYCGVGSVKTNIGHLEPVSGMAGMLKVLLSMRAEQLPPNLHFNTLNPAIRIKDTPFYIVDRAQPWRRQMDISSQPLPYIAGVSSFGFGGSNAHVVLEEYPNVSANSDTNEPLIFVLSARDKTQLNNYAESILNRLAAGAARDQNFRDVIYTLQVGREAMAERLAFVTHSPEHCRRTLEAYLSGAANIENVYHGNISASALSTDLLDQDMMELMIAKRNHKLLAKWWTLGADFDWSGLYRGQAGCRRIPLPTYPFERKRCWLDLNYGRAAEPIPMTIGVDTSAVTAADGAVNVPQPAAAPSPPRKPFEQRVLSKLAQLTGRAVDSIDHSLHLEYDLALDSIKMMGLINDLMSSVDPQQLPYFNRLGMNAIVSQAQTVGKLIEIFENASANEDGLRILDAQYLFLSAYFLTNSSSLCSYVKLKGDIDVNLASQAWNDLIAHHPMLRVYFRWPTSAASNIGGVECKLIEHPNPVGITVTDLRSLAPSEKQQAVRQAFDEKLNRVWNLEQWPLHELSLHRTDDQEYILFWSNEHIISDGLSNQQALRDFLELYQRRASKRDAKLPTYTSAAAYKEVAAAIGNYRDDAEERSLSAYVSAQGRQNYFFNPENSKVTPDNFKFACVRKKLSRDLTRKLIDRVKSLRLPLNSLLTSAYIHVISKYETAQQRIILQIPTSGRIYPGVEASHMIGCFAQNLSLSFERAAPAETLASIVARVHQTIEAGLAGAYDRSQTRQIGELIRSIALADGGVLPQHTKDMLRQNVKSNLYFPYTGHTRIENEYDRLQVADYTAGTTNSPGSIDWLQEIFDDSLHIFVNYDACFFGDSLIDRMVDDYIATLEQLTTFEYTVEPKTNDRRNDSDPALLQRVLEGVRGTSPISVTLDDIHKDMEAELGLDSLDKIRLITRLLTQTGKHVEKSALFACRSIAEIADTLSLVKTASSAPSQMQASTQTTVAVPDDGLGSLNLTDQQQRIPFCKFALTAQQQPAGIAVVNADSSFITYGELNRRSNQLAHYLQSMAIGKGDFVAIMSHRGSDMLTGIMGALKAGATYVPIDPSYPESRILYILNHAKVRVLLTQSVLQEQIGQIRDRQNPIENVVFLNQGAGQADLPPGKANWKMTAAGEWMQHSVSYPAMNPSPADLMVILFTSGSTGNPKGVKLNHAGYINRLEWHQKMFDLQPGERVAQKTSCCFDIAIWELFWPLMYGGTIYAVEREVVSNPWAFAEWVAANQINIAHFVPSTFGEFVNATEADTLKLDSLRWLIFSGEALPTPVIQKWIDKYGLHIGLANLYGPTEASIDVTYHIIDQRPRDEESIPIGKAVDNTYIVIVGNDGKPVQRGELGELCIGGIQLAEGYLYEPELTAKAFINNPFAEIPGACIYRTGDLVKENSDGSIEYHGRLDSQVKIRGFRVELGEIESVLCSNKNVTEAAVLAVDLGESKKLIAWACGTDIDEQRIKAFVREKCPEYMVPHIAIVKDRLPKNHNGKLDRKALLAEFQSRGGSASTGALVPVGPSQKWIFAYFDAPYEWWGYSHIQYNQALDFDVFTMAINKVIDRHGALRTFFTQQDGEWMQSVLNDRPPFVPDFIDACGGSGDAEPKAVIERMKQSIDIGRWPLFRFSIIKRGDTCYDILLVGHHLISDYISGRILFDELWNIYNDGLTRDRHGDQTIVSLDFDELYPQVFSYADFVRAVAAELGDERVEQCLQYWKQYDLGREQRLHIPYDFAGGDNLESSERKLTYKVAKALSGRLRRQVKAHLGCSTYHLLLAPLYKFLSLELGRPWIVLSHKMNGRDLGNGSGNFYQSIGNFAVNYPVGVHIDAGDSLEEIVGKIQREFSVVPLAGLSYDWISNRLPEDMYPDHKISEIRVNYLGDVSAQPVNQRLASPNQVRTAIIEIFLYTEGSDIFFDIAYSSKVYKKSTIDRIAKGYLRQMQRLVEDSINKGYPDSSFTFLSQGISR
jgi:fengycin family lipopeptide synthetase B